MAEPTCDFAWMGDHGPVFCLASPTVDIRFRWVGEPQGPSSGAMCEEHWMVACDQLAVDPDIELGSVQFCRRGAVQ